MKSALIIFVALILVACVAYPSKNVSEPMVDGKISDYDEPEISIVFGDYKSDECGLKLPYVRVPSDGAFVVPSKISYMKVAYLVPTECSLSFLVCVKEKSGKVSSKVISHKSYPCNLDPPTIYLHCFKDNGAFDCR